MTKDFCEIESKWNETDNYHDLSDFFVRLQSLIHNYDNHSKSLLIKINYDLKYSPKDHL